MTGAIPRRTNRIETENLDEPAGVRLQHVAGGRRHRAGTAGHGGHFMLNAKLRIRQVKRTARRPSPGATINKGLMAMRSTGRHWRRRSRSRSTKSWQPPTKEVRNPPQRRGLRKLSSDFIGKARDETATQVTRIGLTFLGTSAFCLLSAQSGQRKDDACNAGGSAI
jgi:hypothetical protein